MPIVHIKKLQAKTDISHIAVKVNTSLS